MYNTFDYEKVENELNNNSILYEGDNNVVILKTYKNIYSLQKEDVSMVKLIYEVKNIPYEIIPFKYNKYSKIFEKYAKNNELWAFQIYGIYNNKNICLYDFKRNRIENDDEKDFYNDEILTIAKKFGYKIHLNEKPNCWNRYSTGLI